MGREARAHAGDQNVPIVFGVTFAKVDKDARTVTGIVTDEQLDRQGEVVDYAVAKEFLTNEKLWPGNIREQHDATKGGVGSKVFAVADDVAKNVELTAYISEACPDTWTKVCDGTLKGFSIGGSGRREIRKQGDTTVKWLILESLAEVSVVDNPANPRAMFTFAKSVDGVMTCLEPIEAVPEPDAIDKALTAIETLVRKADDTSDDDKDKAKTASGKKGKWYAGPDGTSYPITDPVDVHNAAQALGRAKGQDRTKLKANIIRIAYEAGASFVAQLPEAWKKPEDQSEKALAAGHLYAGHVPVRKAGMEPWDIDRALSLISLIESVMSSEYWEAQMAAASGNPNGPEVAQAKLLKQAADLLLAFLMSEWQEQFTAPAGSDSPGALLVDDDDVVQMFAKSLDAVLKAGARHSKGDVEMIQKVHDLSGELGAVCKDMGDADDAGTMAKAAQAKADEPKDCATCKGTGKIRGGHVKCPDCDGTGEAEKAVPVVVAPVASEDVTKLQGLIETVQTDLAAQKVLAADLAKANTAQAERIATLENGPAPGGPVKNATAVVEKTLGGPAPVPGQPGVGDDVMKAYDVLAQSAPDDATRMDLVSKKLSYMHAHGIGAVTRPGKG